MKDRIKKIRKALGLTQQEFADRLGISRGNIATYETRDGNPGSSVITLICREFNVSETWLRTGEGEMFVELPRNEALAVQIQAFLQSGSDSFRERLVSLLLRLTPEQWDALESYARELVSSHIAEQESQPRRIVQAAARGQQPADGGVFEMEEVHLDEFPPDGPPIP